jgi:hypothetical protein
MLKLPEISSRLQRGRTCCLKFRPKPARATWTQTIPIVFGMFDAVTLRPRSAAAAARPCRRGDRIVVLFAAVHMSLPGTNPLTTGSQSMSALPRYIRPQLVPLSRARHRPQRPDIGRCSRSLCGRARAGRPEDCRCADRSTSPLFVGGNGCRKAWVQVRFRQSIQRQAARIGVSSCSGRCRGGS